MMRPPERVDVPEEHEMRERFARMLAILIVVATLGVAALEFLHSVADKNADHAGVEAQKLGVQRQGELVRADDAVRSQVDTFAYGELQRARGGNAFQQFLLPNIQQGSAEAKLLQLEETRWTQLADLTGKLTDIKADSSTAPAQDLAFPNLAVSQKQRESNRLFALQDASNELRGKWQNRVGLLSVILTMFAVAIYLFGLSLTLHAAIRRGLVGLGLLLVAVGTVWTLALQFGVPTAAPEQAADEYADGVTALATFYAQPGDTGLRAADRHFSKAIELRPTFAQAYVQRSQVRFLLGSPQRSDSVVSITTNDALRAQGDDLRHAYDLGNRDKLLLNNLAANSLLLAIHQNQAGEYASAQTYLDAALHLDDNDPLLYYNRGLSLLGQGKTDAARAAYQAAVERTLYTDPAAKTARNDPAREQAYVGGALTPLDLLASQRTDLTTQVRAIKELIVNGVDNRKGQSGGDAKLSNMALQVFPGELQWTGTITGYSTKDEVSTQWYYQGPQKLGWSVLSPVSGDRSPTSDSTGGPDDYFTITRYLQATGQCLQPGGYRVEVYVNGHLAGTAQKDSTIPALTAAGMADVGASVCHPADWKPDQNNVLRGFSSGLHSGDGAAGIYVLRFQNPSVPAGTDHRTEAKAFRDQFFSLPGFLPSAANPQLDTETTSPYFLGLSGANEAYYTYSGGQLRIGSGVTSDGAVLIGVVFAPNDQWQGDHTTGDAIFNSMISLG
jgi:hypothetical protein